MRHLQYSDILKAEALVVERTQVRVSPWMSKFTECVDLIIALGYFFDHGVPADMETPEDWVFHFIYEKYLDAPHSLHACNVLMGKGSYLPALVQVRSSLDAVVSCRYFHEHPKQLRPYQRKQRDLIDGKNKWLGSKEIYSSYSSVYYEKYYGDFLSSLTHGKSGPGSFRVQRTSRTEGRVIMVPEFDLRLAFSVINMLVPIIYAYLHHWPVFFKGRIIDLRPDLEAKRQTLEQWVVQYQCSQLKKHPKMKEFIRETNALIGLIDI